MKLISASVLAFLCILLTPATFANTAPAEHCQLYANPTLCSAPQAREDVLRVREIEAEEAQARQAYNANWIGGVALILTLAMLVAAVKAALYAKESANAAKQSLEDNEKYNKIQTRAYVNAQNIEVENFLVGMSPTFKYNPTNCGSSPAYKLKCKASVFIGNIPQEKYKVFFNKIPYNSEITLNPNQIVSHDLYNDKIKITSDLYKSIINKEVIFLIAGKILYKDIFRKSHRVTFFAYVNTNLLHAGSGKLSSTFRHNKSD